MAKIGPKMTVAKTTTSNTFWVRSLILMISKNCPRLVRFSQRNQSTFPLKASGRIWGPEKGAISAAFAEWAHYRHEIYKTNIK